MIASGAQVKLHCIRRRGWYAGQVDRSVEVFSCSSEKMLYKFVPPTAWNDNWSWWMSDEGIWMQRT